MFWGYLLLALRINRKAQGSGKIINIGSIAGIIGKEREMYLRTNRMQQPIDYVASKGGVVSMTRDLATNMEPYGVCVNCISPGGFQRSGFPESFVKAYSDLTALGRMGRHGIDLKGAALYLASHASDYVIGHNLVVDGGFSIKR
jgi:gluconate 5-dehydrogenase